MPGGPRLALPERHARAASTSSTVAGPARGDRQEQVQGRRALRQAAERLHPAPGSRRPRLVSQHQDPAAAPLPAGTGAQAPAKGISGRRRREPAKRVDVTIDGKPFTSYIYPDTLKKPVLFPIRTSNGTLVTRGFPLDPRPRERFDHPHHVGLWFNHGDVNGLDFWNNSVRHSRRPGAEDGHHPSQARHRGQERRRSRRAGGRDGVGELRMTSRSCARRRAFVFRGSRRCAQHRPHHDAHRARPEGRLPRQQGRLAWPARDARARAARRQAGALHRRERQGDGGAGPRQHGRDRHLYEQRGAEGRQGVGHARPLVHAAGKIGAKPVTIAILDHPSNPNSPTYWHARGYGLFSANVFGRKVFDPKQEELVLTLEPGQVSDVPPPRADPGQRCDVGSDRARIQDVRGTASSSR